MKKQSCKLLAMAAVLLFAVSCTDDDYMDVSVSRTVTDVYILNSGMMDSNNSELAFYDPSTGEVATGVFSLANGGKRLGDSANDMLIYGNRLYIAVTGSAVVFVTDLSGRIVEEIAVKGESANLSPRQLTVGNGKVFVSYKEGYVGAIDTTDFSVITAKVGPFPEGILYNRQTTKLYVAITDGNNYPNFENKVEILNPRNLEKVGEFEVGYNPQTFHYCGDDKIYLVCWGDYGAEPAKLQIIDPLTNAVTTVDGVAPTNMAVGPLYAYILSSEYDENWNQTIKYYVYDYRQEKVIGELGTPVEVPDGYCIFADDDNNIYIGTSDYVSNGDMYVFRQERMGTDVAMVRKFDTGAINPIKVCFKNNIEW